MTQGGVGRGLDLGQAAAVAQGQRWAYRHHHHEDLVEVAVVRVGVRRPKRIQVRFVDDAFEGLEEWVPPARLKVPWEGVDAFRAWEERWAKVTAPTSLVSEPTHGAMDAVFDVLIDDAVAETGWGKEDGVVRIHDPAALAHYLDVEPDSLRDPVLSFEDEGDLVSPIAVGLVIAKHAARLHPQEVLADVERDEREARRDAVYGRFHRGRSPAGGLDMSPEICAQVDEEYAAPRRAILREWCGAEFVSVRAELSTLRRDASRLGELARAALDELHAVGQSRAANRLERGYSAEAACEVGLPPSRVRKGPQRSNDGS